MFITGPAVVKTAISEEIDNEALGGALTHSTKSGVAQFACNHDEEAIEEIKKLLSYLPLNNEEKAPYIKLKNTMNRRIAAIEIRI